MAIGSVQPTLTTSEVNHTPNARSLAQCLRRERERLQRQQQNVDSGQNIPSVSAVSTTMISEAAQTPNARSLAQRQRRECERQQRQQERGQSTLTINEVPPISNARFLGHRLRREDERQQQQQQTVNRGQTEHGTYNILRYILHANDVDRKCSTTQGLCASSSHSFQSSKQCRTYSKCLP